MNTGRVRVVLAAVMRQFRIKKLNKKMGIIKFMMLLTVGKPRFYFHSNIKNIPCFYFYCKGIRVHMIQSGRRRRTTEP